MVHIRLFKSTHSTKYHKVLNFVFIHIIYLFYSQALSRPYDQPPNHVYFWFLIDIIAAVIPAWRWKWPYFRHKSWGVIFWNISTKWNESGFRPPLCTYRLNWARRTSWGWWDEWDDTVLQTQDSKFEPWRSEAEHATSRSRKLPTILTRWWGRNTCVSFKPPRPGIEPRTLAWKAAVLTTTLGPPPKYLKQRFWKSLLGSSRHIYTWKMKNMSINMYLSTVTVKTVTCIHCRDSHLQVAENKLDFIHAKQNILNFGRLKMRLTFKGHFIYNADEKFKKTCLAY